MSDVKMTDREQEYLDCETPLLSRREAAKRIIFGCVTSFAKSIVSPTTAYSPTERKLMRTVREIKYTKYKKAVLRKQNGTPQKKDEKLLQKLNKKDFVLAEDTYDPDEFTRQLYDEYMKKHSEE